MKKVSAALMWLDVGNYHHRRNCAAHESGALDIVVLEIWNKSSYPEFASGVPQVRPYRSLSLGLDFRSFRASRKKIFEALDSALPEIVFVQGWSFPPALAGIEWCAKRSIPCVLMSESTQIDRSRVWWKEFVKRKIVSCVQAAFVGGTRHAEYLVTLGMSRERIAFGYDVVDNSHFLSTISDAKALDGPSTGLQLRRGNYFLSCSRFIAEKNISGLIEAYWMYACIVRQRGESPWPLVLLGDGEQRGSIEEKVNRLQLNDLIVLTGYQPYDVLPKYYRHAGVFVLASMSEPWGLVVNEAMASGLPVLVSNRCGCAADLVVPGRNGFVFDPSDTGSLSALLERVAGDNCDRHAMGSASLEIIANWGLTRFAEGVKKAAEIALSVPVRSASVLDYQILRHLSEREG